MSSQLSVSEARTHSRAVFDRCQAAYRVWVNSGSAYLHREDELFTAWSELSDVGREYRTLAGELWALQYRFAVAFDGLRQGVLGSTETGIVPPAELWTEWDGIESLYLQSQRQKARSLESIDELTRLPGMTDAQIANMYGWVREDGSPDVERVYAEKRKPAADRTIPESPQQARFDAEHQARASKVLHLRDLRNQRLRAMTEPAPEEWKTLFDQGISAKQIADMKRCSIDDVFAAADELGVARPALDYHGGRVAPVHHAENDDDALDELPRAAAVASDEAVGSGDDPVTTARIDEAKMYKKGGYSVEDISQMMGITPGEAKSLLAGKPIAEPAAPKGRGKPRAKAAKETV